jgi:hypothetical protein
VLFCFYGYPQGSIQLCVLCWVQQPATPTRVTCPMPRPPHAVDARFFVNVSRTRVDCKTVHVARCTSPSGANTRAAAAAGLEGAAAGQQLANCRFMACLRQPCSMPSQTPMMMPAQPAIRTRAHTRAQRQQQQQQQPPGDSNHTTSTTTLTQLQQRNTTRLNLQNR